MRQVLFLLGIMLVISACEKNNNDNDNNPGNDPSVYGRYTGTFYRTGMDTTPVTLGLLSTNQFEGTSDRPLYPAICGGNFTFDGSILTVNDTCAWTANFDWTLIFDGNYNVSFTGENAIRIWRTSGSVTDEYLLKKLVR
jgi:hypothetical protein